MKHFNPMIPLLVPSFSSKGNMLISNENGTQVSDNYDLLKLLGVRISESYLVSAYDIYYGLMPQNPNEWPMTDYLFIDSGGYEISGGYDSSERDKYNYHVFPWDKDKMKQVYRNVISCPQFADSVVVLTGFDLKAPFEQQLHHIQTLSQEFSDELVDFIIKPMFPFPLFLETLEANMKHLYDVPIIGLSEKDLGDTIRERLLNLIMLKKKLLSHNWFGKIHVFGGLEPNLVAMYYGAGADIFDGLSWQKIRYRNNSTLFDPHEYCINADEYCNKYFMMIDNLAILHEIALRISSGVFNRTDLMHKLEKILHNGECSISTVIERLEMEL